ncbi:MAG: polyphosphate kinase 1, partial [Bacteroidetes bacterium]|nr:polyphosphate kinase 1 [Bacteroidota bacterium]
VAGFLQPKLLTKGIDFFPENNQLYMAVIVEQQPDTEKLYLVNIPVGNVPRFLKVPQTDADYYLFLEDIIKVHLGVLFPGATVKNAYNIKITRDAELDLQDEYSEDLAEKIEKQLSKRDFGYATRFLYEPGIPLRHLQTIVQLFNFQSASVVEGGRHHNLKDLASLPVHNAGLSYPAWPDLHPVYEPKSASLFDLVAAQDRMIHAPYQSYDTILRFFNEAAIDPGVEEVYTTLYRVASNSRIVHALISAARNGKKVSALVELKARFDEANNIRWAKEMKAAGIKIIYSNNALKVHAKIALVKRKHASAPYLGLLATGNLNETTAHFYTDHILLTANRPLLEEMESLFAFLAKRKKPDGADGLTFNNLLVAQFNLQQRFLELIDREMDQAAQGLPAAITIKLNNLE